MSKRVEMIGKRFTRLVVVEEVEKNKHGHRMFRCICDCGKETIVSGNDLRRNKIKSCGCLQKDNRHQNCRVLDLVGKRFGRLVVIKEAENNKFNQRRYLCKCDCGNEVLVIATRLNQNLTRSCGCLSKDTTTERNYTHKGSRLNVLHWDLERAITEPLHSTKKRKVAKNKQN